MSKGAGSGGANLAPLFICAHLWCQLQAGPHSTHITASIVTAAGVICVAHPVAEGICADKALFGIQQFGSGLPPPPTISKSDEEFLAMGLEFVVTREDIKVTELNELFEKV